MFTVKKLNIIMNVKYLCVKTMTNCILASCNVIYVIL